MQPIMTIVHTKGMMTLLQKTRSLITPDLTTKVLKTQILMIKLLFTPRIKHSALDRSREWARPGKFNLFFRSR